MSTTWIKLPVGLVEVLAEDLYSSEPGDWIGGDEFGQEGVWRLVARQREGSGRWDEHWLMVIEEERSGILYGIDYGIDYSTGLTENQPNTYPWRKDMWAAEPLVTVDAYKLTAHIVTSITYHPATE